MKSLVVLVSVFMTVMAQRPSYLGSGAIGRPGLANRFKETEAPPTDDLSNRIGENGVGSSTERASSSSSATVPLTNPLNRPNTPFWQLNAQHIEAQLYPQRNQGAGTQQQNVPSQSVGDNSGLIPDVNTQTRNGGENPTNVQQPPFRPVQTRGSFAGSSSFRQ